DYYCWLLYSGGWVF
nr:immunoglobulin light chain junction region [Macaca mulatta]MOX33048.1 immunoglobulin light chain junction region [Macaca mulatta]